MVEGCGGLAGFGGGLVGLGGIWGVAWEGGWGGTQSGAQKTLGDHLKRAKETRVNQIRSGRLTDLVGGGNSWVLQRGYTCSADLRKVISRLLRGENDGNPEKKKAKAEQVESGNF